MQYGLFMVVKKLTNANAPYFASTFIAERFACILMLNLLILNKIFVFGCLVVNFSIYNCFFLGDKSLKKATTCWNSGKLSRDIYSIRLKMANVK